ncbi:MAG: hypothetical protein L3J51_11360 [Cocleimonas sp.]|nr:hypothetical protein [Cocleimonas sp.]
MWFKKLTGFPEKSPNQVRENLILEDDVLISKVTGESFACGSLSIPSLRELRAKVQSIDLPEGRLSVKELVADAQVLHVDKENSGSLFQVASQFNLLEMVSPEVSPESGVDGYEYDHTQGPACAIAAGAGTIYRNYFVMVDGKFGQSSNRQIDTLFDMGKALGNTNNKLWSMKNGYALASEYGLNVINKSLSNKNEKELDELRAFLRIGLQKNTEVTLSSSKHKVSQVYCSALPVAYSQHASDLWRPFASLVLEASYEATLCAAILNAVHLENRADGNKKVFLTMLGGGAFGNESSWIMNSIERALLLYKDVGLEVYIVSYGSSNHQVRSLVNKFN